MQICCRIVFAQIGGEEKADYAAELRVGEKVGPGMALAAEFGEEAEIVATV
ncbi:MAG: glycine/sarcosine/betaine reductase selenoprotein B family protein, partial [Treponema socranskii subsp. buccale]